MLVQIGRDANKHLEQLTVLIWTGMGAAALICRCRSLNRHRPVGRGSWHSLPPFLATSSPPLFLLSSRSILGALSSDSGISQGSILRRR